MKELTAGDFANAHVSGTWLFLLALLAASIPASAADETELVTARAAGQEVNLTGFTRARTILALSAEASGKIERVYADIGDAIPADGMFACLDKTFVNLDIRDNAAGQKSLKADINYFRKQLTRFRQLLQKSSTAQSQLDGTERNLINSRQQLASLKIQGEVLTERKKRHCITAPEGWLVAERMIEPGQWVREGETVARLGDYTKLLVPFALSVREHQALLAKREQLAVVLLDLNKQVAASIAHIYPSFDERSRKIKVDLEITGDTGLLHNGLRGGLRVQLALRLPLNSGTVLIPEKALVKRYEEYWLKRDNNKDVRVTYLGHSDEKSADGTPLVKVSSSKIHPGDKFQILKPGK